MDLDLIARRERLPGAARLTPTWTPGETLQRSSAPRSWVLTLGFTKSPMPYWPLLAATLIPCVLLTQGVKMKLLRLPWI